MKKYLHLMHYCMYKINCLAYNLNPLLLIYKLPFLKRFFVKKGYNPIAIYHNTMNHPADGFSSMFAASEVVSVVGLFLTGLIGLFLVKLKIYFNYLYLFVFIMICSYLFGVFVLWKKDLFKEDFKKFDLMERWKKVLWALLTLLFSAMAVFICFKSLIMWGRTFQPKL